MYIYIYICIYIDLVDRRDVHDAKCPRCTGLWFSGFTRDSRVLGYTRDTPFSGPLGPGRPGSHVLPGARARASQVIWLTDSKLHPFTGCQLPNPSNIFGLFTYTVWLNLHGLPNPPEIPGPFHLVPRPFIFPGSSSKPE